VRVGGAIEFLWRESQCEEAPRGAFSVGDRQRAIVSAALDTAVTSYADADRLLRTETQVQFHESSRVEQSLKRLQVAPALSSRIRLYDLVSHWMARLS
jgi:hypothetical protein